MLPRPHRVCGGSNGATSSLMTMMFFLLPSSRQTRRTIWSGVSVNGLSPLFCLSSCLVSFPAGIRSRSLNAWKLVMIDLGPVQLRHQLRRHKVMQAIVVLRVVGEQYAQPVLDRDARRDDQERIGVPVAQHQHRRAPSGRSSRPRRRRTLRPAGDVAAAEHDREQSAAPTIRLMMR